MQSWDPNIHKKLENLLILRLFLYPKKDINKEKKPKVKSAQDSLRAIAIFYSSVYVYCVFAEKLKFKSVGSIMQAARPGPVVIKKIMSPCSIWQGYEPLLKREGSYVYMEEGTRVLSLQEGV